MKGGIPLSLKETPRIGVAFTGLVLHLQKSTLLELSKTFKLLWLCPDSLFNRSRIPQTPDFGSAESFIGVQKKLRE